MLKNYELRDKIVKIENYASSLKDDLEEANDCNAKENLKIEKLVEEKKAEIKKLKFEVKDFKTLIESITIKPNEKEIFRLQHKMITLRIHLYWIFLWKTGSF